MLCPCRNLFEICKEGSIYVAEINEKLVGFVTIRIDGVGNIGAYIKMIAVDQVFRGSGIGAQLIDYVSGIAAENIPNLFLICSVSFGHDEIFYRKSLGSLYKSSVRHL